MGSETWRLIVTPPYDGASNMAVDEAILESVGAENELPTLRLYAWNPASLSLGYAQHAKDADLDRLAGHGWHIVRRPTGGRAILHTDELTYSVTLPESHPLIVGSILDSYRRLSAALMLAVEQMGAVVNADRQTERNKSNGPVCFEVPSHYEITAGGKKLIGSAQVRRNHAALQHGTLPLTGDISRITDVLHFIDEPTRESARERVRRRATTLSEALEREVTWDEAANAVIAAFRTTFDLTLEPAELSDLETERAAYWHTTRYAADEWTFRM